MLNLDWVAVWKIVSIILTGAFGVLGLLTKYKDDDGKITRWGKVSLAGILISTAFGAAVQIKEMSDKEAAAIQAAAQMLEITKQTKKSVDNLERLLRPLDAPSLYVQFKVPCEHQTYAEFCKRFRDVPDDAPPADRAAVWEQWPSARMNDVPHQPELRATISIRAKRDSQSGVSSPPAQDWTLRYIASPFERDGQKSPLELYVGPDGELRINLKMDAPTDNDNQGNFQSILDLDGLRMILSVSTPPVILPMPKQPDVVGFKPEIFTLGFRNGQTIQVPVDGLAEGHFVRRVDRSFATTIALKR